MTVTTLPDRAHVPAVPRRRPRALLGASVVVAAFLVLPLVFLLLQAHQVGWAQISELLFRQLTATLLWNTVSLSVVVTAASAVIGTAAAWLHRTDGPSGPAVVGRCCVIPVAIPDFVVSFGWVSIFPSLHGFGGAVLVMTLAVYPLVYLPVAASFRGADPGQEEVARGLGLRSGCGPSAGSRWPGAARHSRRQPAGGAGLLAEYGAFEILRYPTFTTEIFAEFQRGFDLPPPVPCRSSSSCSVWCSSPATASGAAADGPSGPVRRPPGSGRRTGWVAPRCRWWRASPRSVGSLSAFRSGPSSTGSSRGPVHSSRRRLVVVGRLAHAPATPPAPPPWPRWPPSRWPCCRFVTRDGRR